MANRSSVGGRTSHDGGWLNPGLRDEFTGASILLVEDDDDIRELLETMLELAGFETTACASAEAALEELREQPFDLVLTDYMLPHRTGAWLLEQASIEGLINATPVLVVTAHPHPPDVGDYEIIPKPFDLDDLVSKVRRQLDSPTRRPKMPLTAPATGSGAGDGHDGSWSEPVELVLYVNAHSTQSMQAIKTIEQVVSRFSSDRVTLTIHDLSQDPSKGQADAIAFTPTLVRRSPGPRTLILGDITDPEIVAELVAGYGDS